MLVPNVARCIRSLFSKPPLHLKHSDWSYVFKCSSGYVIAGIPLSETTRIPSHSLLVELYADEKGDSYHFGKFADGSVIQLNPVHWSETPPQLVWHPPDFDIWDKLSVAGLAPRYPKEQIDKACQAEKTLKEAYSQYEATMKQLGAELVDERWENLECYQFPTHPLIEFYADSELGE
jgi:hypothetical protein